MDGNEDREEGKGKKKRQQVQAPGLKKKKRVVWSGLVFRGREKDSLSLRAGERVGATGADGKRSDKK